MFTSNTGWFTRYMNGKRYEALITEYTQLREEIRDRASFNQKQLTRSMGVIGVVGGYSALSGRLVLVTLIPIIIVVVGVLVSHTLTITYFLGLRVREIEAQLPDGQEMWEHQYGGLADGPRWSELPAMVVYLLMGIGFVLSTGTSLAIIHEEFEQYFHLGIIFYTFLLVLLGVALFSLKQTKDYIREKAP